jgi:hypothetical protein
MKYYNYPDPRGTEVAENVDSKNISNFAPGGGGSVFIVNAELGNDRMTLDKTFNEILNARNAGKTVMCAGEFGSLSFSTPVLDISSNPSDSDYNISIRMSTRDSDFMEFYTDNPDGYPVFSPDDSNN